MGSEEKGGKEFGQLGSDNDVPTFRWVNWARPRPSLSLGSLLYYVHITLSEWLSTNGK